jgi:hypothetical protein
VSVDHYVDIVDIADDYVPKLQELIALKESKKHIEDQITVLQAEIAETYPRGGTFVDEDGFQQIVTVRRDPNPPKIDLELLTRLDPDLAGKITKFAVDNDKAKQYIDRGYFTNTPAAQALSLTYKKAWVQITTAKETDE